MSIYSKQAHVRGLDKFAVDAARFRGSDLGRRLAPVSGGMVLAAFLCACAGPAMSAKATPASIEAAGDICSNVMGFDVSGVYYFKCRDYLSNHGGDQVAPVPVRSETAEHQACHSIGLKDNTDAYADCIQTMYQLDDGSIHL